MDKIKVNLHASEQFPSMTWTEPEKAGYYPAATFNIPKKLINMLNVIQELEYEYTQKILEEAKKDNPGLYEKILRDEFMR